MMRVFKDRHDAGAQLAHALHRFSDSDAVVIAHTRASVAVAYEVATRLGLSLDLLERDEPSQLAHGSQLDIAASESPAEVDLRDRTVLLVDDGDAARTMPSAIERLRERGAATVVAAVGVVSPAVYTMLIATADHTTVLLTPQHLYSIEAWYADLSEPSDDDIRQMLVTAARNVMVLQRSSFLSPRV